MPFRLPFRIPKRETSKESEELLMNNPTEGKLIAHYPKSRYHPAYWKVSSVAGTTRVFASESLEVSDSATRHGETDTEWRLRLLLRDLQALASNPETLVAAYDARVPVVYEIVNDCRIHVEWASKAGKEGKLSEDTWNTARALDAKLGELPDIDDTSQWTIEALRLSPAWQEIRLLAQDILAAMGRPLEPPAPMSM